MRTLYINGTNLRGETINLLVENDKIIASSQEQIEDSYDEYIDLEGKLIIPGIIDIIGLNDFLSGDVQKMIDDELESYIRGGITNIAEYPTKIEKNVNYFDIVRKIIEIKNNESKINFNIGNFFDLNRDESDFQSVVYSMVTKLSLPTINEESKDSILESFKKIDKIVKNENAIIISMYDENIDSFLKYYKNKETKIIFTDVITEKDFRRIEAFKQQGYNFYNMLYIDSLFINEELCINEVYEKKYRYSRKFSKKEDSKFFIRMLKENKVDILIPHHLPMSVYDKMERYQLGNPNAETFFPILMDLCRMSGIPYYVLENVLFNNPKKILETNDILSLEAGSLASFAVFDLSKMWFVKNDDIISKANWTPYENKQLWCVIDMVLVNGIKIYKNSQEESEFTPINVKTRSISTKKIEKLFIDDEE